MFEIFFVTKILHPFIDNTLFHICILLPYLSSNIIMYMRWPPLSYRPQVIQATLFDTHCSVHLIFTCTIFVQDIIYRLTFSFLSISIVFFTYGWRKSAHDTSIVPRVLSGLSFGLVVLSCLFLSKGKRFIMIWFYTLLKMSDRLSI